MAIIASECWTNWRGRNMAEKLPIVFKSEASLWALVNQLNPDGHSAKPFDMRRWDLADERIYRLAWGHYDNRTRIRLDGWKLPPLRRLTELRGTTYGWAPDEKSVSFLNKDTGALLTFEYLGVEFTPWAPGWGFLLLGRRLSPPVEET
jgi:hypothetical protein